MDDTDRAEVKKMKETKFRSIPSPQSLNNDRAQGRRASKRVEETQSRGHHWTNHWVSKNSIPPCHRFLSQFQFSFSGVKPGVRNLPYDETLSLPATGPSWVQKITAAPGLWNKEPQQTKFERNSIRVRHVLFYILCLPS